MSGLWLPPRVSYQGAFVHPPAALRQVPPQSGSPMWGNDSVAASSTLQRVPPREVTHDPPTSHIPPHPLINLRILGPSGQGLGQRPSPAGALT